MNNKFDLENSIQINDGLTQTSADGINMAFDSKYGIMFCLYMPGHHGSYGESRGRIALTYFPASQPTNTKTIEISAGNEEYVPNLISLGDGKIRALYAKNSRSKGDHYIHYKDFDFITKTLSEESIVMVKQDDGNLVPLTSSVQFAYLDKHNCHEHVYVHTEQIAIGGHTVFDGGDGYLYGAVSSYLSEVILYRSADNLATLEFFAVYPKPAQYEFDYKILNGKLHAVYRTNKDIDSIAYVCSDDFGKSWTDPVYFKESIQCRPRMIVYDNHILMAYNYFNSDTGNRPEIQQGRTSVKICYGEEADPNDNIVVADLYSKYGIVNICLSDVLGDIYFGYSSSVLALEYQNGNPKVRGKDSARYVKLGDLRPQA